MRKYLLWPIFFLILFSSIIFKIVILKDNLPIPADTIVGLYHPYIDYYAKEYPRGVPFKNFLITDPIRQTFPWRFLAVESEKLFQLPMWNPYSLAGTPLLANFQSSVFYPLNFLFFLLPFYLSWSILVLSAPVLGGIFMFLYLLNKKLNKYSCLIGGISFALSGFFVAWLEWNVLTQVILWIPLIFLSIDKIIEKIRGRTFWLLIFIFSLSASFFAGHLQTFFYVFMTLISYFIFQIWKINEKKKLFLLFILALTGFFIITLPQSLPGARLIINSARDVDPISIESESQFIPWEQSIQFVAPDFFGNPAKGNYWGVWNYGEFVGYIGLFPLILALFALCFRRGRETIFFGTVLLISLILAFPTLVAKLPFIFHVPFLSTSQPTRLLALSSFSLAVLAALGLDYYEKEKRKFFIPLGIITIIFVLLWLFVLDKLPITHVLPSQMFIAKKNLYLPSLLLLGIYVAAFLGMVIKQKKYMHIFYILIFALTIFDLFWFATRFNTFTKKEFLFPKTKVIKYLQDNIGNNRYMSVDWRILPPNFSIMYKLQSIDGYDPLYLRRYGEFIVASEREKADLSTPFGFYKRITPYNYKSRLIDLLGVKYVLSLYELNSPKLIKVYEEGLTKIYENKNVLPRAFFIKNLLFVQHDQRNLEILFDPNFNLRESATIDEIISPPVNTTSFAQGKSTIISYRENEVLLKTENSANGFLLLTDVYYPTWRVQIDGKDVKVYRADYVFRGVFVPIGSHVVRFYNTLF